MTFNLLGGDQVLNRLGEVALEVSVTDHLIKCRASFRVTQKTLREEEDKLQQDKSRSTQIAHFDTYRLAEITMNLAAKNVEVVCRCARRN